MSGSHKAQHRQSRREPKENKDSTSHKGSQHGLALRSGKVVQIYIDLHRIAQN